MLDLKYLAAVLATVFVINLALRAVPFAILQPLRRSRFVNTMAAWMPVGIVVILAASTFRSVAGDGSRGAGSAEPAANRSAIIEFIVTDVDAEYERLRGRLDEVVTEPTTMPWGNRALLFRDPDGNLVNLFTPVSDEARVKFGG